MSSDGEMRHRLQERVEEADLTLSLQVAAGKTPKWAQANIELAEALVALAAEEEGLDAFSCYDQAIGAYEQALEVYKQETHLGEWGGVIVALVRALRTYAAREGGHMSLLRLERGQKLLNTAIAAMPEGKGQFDRAMLLIELAHLHRIRGDIDRAEKRLGHLQATIASFEQAAQILRAKENFDNWATAIIGQAMAWREVAALETPPSLTALLRSVELFKSAAHYYTPRRHLDDWVFCHFEHGRTLLRLSRLVQGEACRKAAEEAVACFKRALAHVREDYTPELWMRCHIDMAFSYIKLEAFADTDKLISLIEEEISIFRMAAEYYSAQGDTVTFSLMASSLGQKLLQLADFREGGQARELRAQALVALRHSVSDMLENAMPDDWLSNVVDLGIALHNVAIVSEGQARTALSEEAASVYRRALGSINTQHNANAAALLRNRLGRLLTVLGEDDESAAGLTRLQEAETYFRQAQDYYKGVKGWPQEKQQDERSRRILVDLVRFESNFCALLYALAHRVDDKEAKKYLNEAQELLADVMKRVDERCGSSDWYEAYALYGRIFKYRLERDFVADWAAECAVVAAVLRQALAQASEADAAHEQLGAPNAACTIPDMLSRMILCRHLADIVYMWGRIVPKATGRALFDEAHGLITQLRDWAVQSGNKEIACSSEEELTRIEMFQDTCRRGWMLRRIWSWAKSLNIRWA